MSLKKCKSEKIKLNNLWFDLDYILNADSFTEEFLNTNKDIREIEHQVGRFLNMKAIINEINLENSFVGGDIVEFGTWQGLSLVYFARMLEANTFNRRLIGIDSFEGLPHDSNIWRKGLFSNTELNFVSNNFLNYTPVNFTTDSLILIKGWYSDAAVKEKLYSTIKYVAVVHFDADLGSSTLEALRIVEPYLVNRKEPIYFLFDDWGCHPDEVPDTFFDWLNDFQQQRKVKEVKLSSTKFTRYYKLIFSNE